MRAEVLAFIESRTGSRITETKVNKHDKNRQEQVLRLLLHLWQGRPQVHRVLVKRQSSNEGSGRNQNANVTSWGKGKSVGKGAEGAKGHPNGQGKSKGKGVREVETS